MKYKLIKNRLLAAWEYEKIQRLLLHTQIIVSISFRNLLYLKNYDGDADDLTLNFTVMNNDYGETKVYS